MTRFDILSQKFRTTENFDSKSKQSLDLLQVTLFKSKQTFDLLQITLYFQGELARLLQAETAEKKGEELSRRNGSPQQQSTAQENL